MESSGIAARIRAVEGCLGYDYFYPADDPNGLLLIDSWQDQAARKRLLPCVRNMAWGGAPFACLLL